MTRCADTLARTFSKAAATAMSTDWRCDHGCRGVFSTQKKGKLIIIELLLSCNRRNFLLFSGDG